ncbi:MAG: hypothetical protein AAFW89_04360 [Bacteroidota bacterium]
MADQTEQHNEETAPEQHKERGLIEDFLGDILNLDRGLPGTIWLMLKSPHEVVNSFFAVPKKYVNPFRYTIILTTITTFISVQFIDYEEMMKSAMDAGGDSADVIAGLQEQIPTFDWQLYFDNLLFISTVLIEKYAAINYIVLFAPMLALSTFLLFRKHMPKYKQHFVMNLYGISTLSLFGIIWALLVPLLEQSSVFEGLLYTIIPTTLYCCWVIFSSLGFKTIKGFLGALAGFFLGYMFYSIILTIVMYFGAFVMTMAG